MNLNPNEICFIICTNNEENYTECTEYLNRLAVPEGMSMDIIKITDADSICSAYNAAMKDSNAKYKVYLHHDLLIINQNFISDLIACFDRNPKAGIVGIIGRKFLPDTLYMFGGEQYGAAYENQVDKSIRYYLYSQEGCDEKVMHLDGMLLATCVDLPWREDVFDGFDFYDTSQSLEMIRAGYEVVVPYSKIPWVIHACGYLSLKNYPAQREKFVKEYTDFPLIPVTVSITTERH